MKKTYFLMASFMALTILSYAQAVTWDGGAATTNWSDAMNWSNDIVPTATTDVLLDMNGSTIDITGSAVASTVEVKNNNVLNIASGATLTIASGSVDDGLETAGSGTIINDGTIMISTSATNDRDGIYSKGTFTNNGAIDIDGVGEHGIYVQEGVFTNASSGTITITNVGQGDGNADGIYLDDNSGAIATIVNDGTITVTMTSGDDGVYIKDGCLFDNNSILNIDGVVDMGLHLIGPSSQFNNSGDVTIDGGPDYAIQIDGNNVTPACFIDNSGTMTVNGGSDDGMRMRRGAYFDNSGTLIFDNSGDEGIQIDDSSVGGSADVSTFDNSGTVEIIDATQHGMELFGNFNNLAGGLFKADLCADDGIRCQNNTSHDALFTNDGDIRIDNSGSEDIEADDTGNFTNSATATFAPGSSPGDLEIRDDFDFGAACITFEIDGTTQTTDYDVVVNSVTANTLTISGATAKLEWGFTPAVGDCFTIVDGSGQVSGEFATINSDDPSLTLDVDYQPTEVIICIEAIVPVELVSFEGRKTEKGTDLKWATASEINNEAFEIERSTNSTAWGTIGRVDGKGNSSSLESYSFLDANPLNGVNYYRLKQNDYDGNFEYSNIVAVNYRTTIDDLTSFPNPVEDVLYIDSNVGLENVELQLVNMQGRVVWSNIGWMPQVPMNNLSAGTYILTVKSASVNRTKKIVKK